MTVSTVAASAVAASARPLRPRLGQSRRLIHLALAAAATLTALAGCGGGVGGETPPPTSLTVVSHDSFVLSDQAKERFATQSGLDVVYISPGNAGTVLNQLILTADSPLGDVVFGLDNTFATRAVDAGVLTPYTSPALPAGAESWGLEGGALTPVDYGDVCLNADDAWFADHGLALPETLDDLVKPAYADLLVVPNPASSSPGLAFLAATVGAKGDPGYLAYWAALTANGVLVTSGWTEAYTVEFSGSSGQGPRPLVLSYASSPLYEIGPDGQSRTSALPKTCFRQVEYAGVIAGAANPDGARQFIDFLLSAETQSEIPETMYMSPVNPAAAVPADWAAYTDVVTDPIEVSASLIAEKREDWIRAWTETVLG
ncbi:MAG: thiamine ABC transporter substrate-binding protein [Propionibacteriaceae bacterium]|jgi:thiamine transport system substrate-binding protein|nr:thiamine ABC transporter substrate-binding protein [Propionibacteriaceae bacterium]